MDRKTKRMRDAFTVWRASVLGLIALLAWCVLLHALEVW